MDLEAQLKFQDKLAGMTKAARHMRITNAAGTDIEFDNDPDRPVTNEGDYSLPGGHFLIGQIGWAPKEETINGVIAFRRKRWAVIMMIYWKLFQQAGT